MAEINDEIVKVEEPSITTGTRLKKAREDKKLTIVDVAAQLKLIKENISALEDGRWDKLHGRTYARGYFSSYVKFLGLPEEELLAAFNNEYESSSEPVLKNIEKISEGGGFSLFKLILLMVIGAVAWFGYQYWLTLDNQPIFEALDELVNNDSGDDEPFNESVIEPMVSPSVEPEIESTDNVVVDIEINTVTEPLDKILPEIDEVNQEGASDSAAEIQIETDGVSTTTEEFSEEIIEDIQSEMIEEKAQAEIVGTHIELQFSKACWISIKDVDGQVLVSKLMEPDTNLNLNGKPPLKVSLGRASAVNMKVNGKTFDLAPHTRGEVAKFTLGDEL